jgi:peptidoglycan/xylan/chitin deacetylase (PgdA/CDA1 family)
MKAVFVIALAAIGIHLFHHPRAMASLQQVAQPPLDTSRVNAAQVRKDDSDWQHAQREICASQHLIDGRLSSIKASTLRNSVLREGNGDRKEIALTFDDGPHPKFTSELLKILKSENVPATFFVVGFMAEKYPDLLRAIKSGGHEIGNHTYSHVTLTKIPSDQVLTEYRANNDAIFKITGSSVKYCRPPGGDFNDNVLRDSASLGMTTVLWTDDPGDYANPGDDVLYEREVAKLDSGAIVLLHDGSQNTLDTLQKFIRTAKRKGYKFVTLDRIR